LRRETIRHSGERIWQSGEQIGSVYGIGASFFGISPRIDLRILPVIYVQYVNEEQQQAAVVVLGKAE
jgi:hypothetical protein